MSAVVGEIPTPSHPNPTHPYRGNPTRTHPDQPRGTELISWLRRTSENTNLPSTFGVIFKQAEF